MKEKKRIADFIESVKEGDISSSTILLGGAMKDPDELLSSSNGGDCSNASFDSCNKSTNRGGCKNVVGMCNNSKNGGACNNAVEAPKPTNTSCSTSGTV